MNAKIVRNPLLGLVSLTMLAFFSGCSSGPEINFEADRKVNVVAYKTYTLIPFNKTKGVQGGSVNPGSSLKYAEPVTRSIRNSLTTKGYTEAAEGTKPDFYVNLRATVVPKTDVTDWGLGYGGYPGWGGGYYGGYRGGAWAYGGMGYDVTVDQYNEGVLRIEIYDGASKELAWVGWAKDRIYKAPDESQIALAITAILGNFPPPPVDPKKKK